jgi:peptide deformylase
MAIKSIVKMGNENLAKPSLPVFDFSDRLEAIVKDMEDSMHESGGVGIAAPQIGVNLNIILFGFEKNYQSTNALEIPKTVLINPSFKILSDEMVDGWEGCLSVPGLRGLVPRYYKIRYQGYDLNGLLIVRDAEGFHARVLQHEYDHLEGILYPRRIKDLTHFGFEDELNLVI